MCSCLVCLDLIVIGWLVLIIVVFVGDLCFVWCFVVLLFGFVVSCFELNVVVGCGCLCCFVCFVVLADLGWLFDFNGLVVGYDCWCLSFNSVELFGFLMVWFVIYFVWLVVCCRCRFVYCLFVMFVCCNCVLFALFAVFWIVSLGWLVVYACVCWAGLDIRLVVASVCYVCLTLFLCLLWVFIVWFG